MADKRLSASNEGANIVGCRWGEGAEDRVGAVGGTQTTGAHGGFVFQLQAAFAVGPAAPGGQLREQLPVIGQDDLLPLNLGAAFKPKFCAFIGIGLGVVRRCYADKEAAGRLVFPASEVRAAVRLSKSL